MGFSTSIAFIILFIVGMAVATELATSYGEYAILTNSLLSEKTKKSLEELNSKIRIVHVKNGENTKIYVENSGTKTLDPQYLYLVVDGKWISQDNYSITGLGYIKTSLKNETKLVKGAFYNGSLLTLTTREKTLIDDSADEIYGIIGWYNITVVEWEFVQTNTTPEFYWPPGEVVEITYPHPVSTKVKVINEYGNGDTYYINSTLGHYHLMPVEGYTYEWGY